MRIARASDLGARIFGISTDANRSEPIQTDSRSGRKRQGPIEWHDDVAHAKRLVRWMYEGDEPLAPGEVTARDLQAAYRDMVAEASWVQRPYNCVSREVRKLLGGKKTYTDLMVSGVKVRTRVFRFPPRCSV
jgi:hypothetical protein